MRVRTYTLDYSPGPDADLRCDAQLQLWLDDMPVLAISFWGSKTALTLIDRLVLITTQDYGNITKYGRLIDRRDDTTPDAT